MHVFGKWWWGTYTVLVVIYSPGYHPVYNHCRYKNSIVHICNRNLTVMYSFGLAMAPAVPLASHHRSLGSYFRRVKELHYLHYHRSTINGFQVHVPREAFGEPAPLCLSAQCDYHWSTLTQNVLWYYTITYLIFLCVMYMPQHYSPAVQSQTVWGQSKREWPRKVRQHLHRAVPEWMAPVLWQVAAPGSHSADESPYQGRLFYCQQSASCESCSGQACGPAMGVVAPSWAEGKCMLICALKHESSHM